MQLLFSQIRFKLLTHEQLRQASKCWYIPKQLVLDAISARLNPFEGADSFEDDHLTARVAPNSPTKQQPEEQDEQPEPEPEPTIQRNSPHHTQKAREFGLSDPRGPLGKDVRMCSFVSDMDRNGMLHYIGTNQGRALWNNPSINGQVTVMASSCAHGEVHDLVGRTIANFRTRDEQGSWIIIDLGERRRARVSHYTIMSRQFKSHYLKHWVLEASVQGAEWVALSTHCDEDSLAGGLGKFHTWEIGVQANLADVTSAADADSVDDLPSEFVRFLRLRQLGSNSSGSHNLMLSCVEIYGLLCTF
eukprot:TRINITY_DN3444_c0_g1_i1.p1 TRINITY_DN3444_c0_g1~~TRINITY_DN3444_c0_g1_i1.p1  ORF type:complete len:303 (-),score=48.37 TRINITY_DN3444_c0_g1_i1:244-1152(-)